MIDIHCHILPGVDDGAENWAESVEMARLAWESGVTGIVATPHFHGEMESLTALHRIFDRYQQLVKVLHRDGIPIKLYPGAEILCTPQTAAMAREKALPTLGNTNYVLTEFFFDAPFEHMDAMLDGISQYDYIPVIAHPERYETIMRNPRGVEQWFRKGYIIQLNKGSVLGAFGYQVQNTAQWVLNAGLAHVIASDAHSASRRTPDMTPLRQHLSGSCPAPYIQVLLEENPSRLIRGLNMVPAE